jgi:hypothetical protein
VAIFEGRPFGEGGVLDNSGKDPGTYIANNTEKVPGNTDGPGGVPIKVLGTDSLFNPFYIFRYSKFAQGTTSTSAGDYNILKHKNQYHPLPRQVDESIQNPTANAIIAWANNNASKKTGPLYPYPYQINDFLWCKWYGKIPNNRLLTLRRYPIPVEDNLGVHQEKLPLVPIAQAVTWWGTDTGNSLSNILGINYGFNWDDRNATLQDLEGNEVLAEALTDAIGLKVSDTGARQALRKSLIMALGTNPNNPHQASNYDKTLQDATKENWQNGAYWNRVKGPINSISSTKIRTEGFTFKHNIKLEFEYNLRSYGNINPKVAMLDLISNFLSLTYNKANFWGGGYRYYERTGYTLPGFNTEALEKGDYVNGLKDILGASASQITGVIADLQELMSGLSTELQGEDIEEMSKTIGEKLGGTRFAKDIVGSRMSGIMQKPLIMRSLLDGRAVGEWHLMVGNPMDPIAVIGNLCLVNTQLTFSDEMGADDFPTSVKFTLNLESGRPRAKQDIESMFNLGAGDLAFTALQPPSSAYNSYGNVPGTRLAMAHGTNPGEDPIAREILNKTANSVPGGAEALSADETAKLKAREEAINQRNYVKGTVSNRYGEGFANSPILVDYFLDLKIKD